MGNVYVEVFHWTVVKNANQVKSQ